MAKTKTDFLQDMVTRYRKSGGLWPSTAKHIAAWAIQNGHWKPPQKNLITQCALEIASAMRQEFFTDPQGRKVRRKHAFREVRELLDGTHEQLFLWIDVKDAPSDQVEMAFQYGRKMISNDCKQLKTDVDSYNDNNPHGAYVEVDFNFAPDMEEASQPTCYPGL